MAVIFEVVAISGKVLERHIIRNKEVSIGRAYDNDLILSDNTVDAHHASIELADDGIRVLDLDSTNGLRHKHQLVGQSKLINSGDELIVGKTHLRIYKSDHAVPEAVAIAGTNKLINIFSRAWVTIALLIILSLLVTLEAWSASIVEFKLRGYIEAVFIVNAIVIIYALVWGVVGKVIKHAMFFKTQLSLIAAYLIVSYITDFIYGVLLFNTLNYVFVTFFSVILEIFILGYLFWFNLEVSTFLSHSKKWIFSLLIAISLISLSMYTEIIDRTEFSNSPHLIQKILPPVLRYAPSQDIDEFIDESHEIFAH